MQVRLPIYRMAGALFAAGKAVAAMSAACWRAGRERRQWSENSAEDLYKI
jgi:hypothetical protein